MSDEEYNKTVHTPIYLLKTKSGTTDGYEEYFYRKSPSGSHSWIPYFVPVLSHTFIKSGRREIESLFRQKAFSHDHSDPYRLCPMYGGLIFTSQRAVDAFGKVVQHLRGQDPCYLTQGSLQTLLYVVGPATGRQVRSLGLPWPVLGEDCGNGDALADFILEHYNTIYPNVSNRPPLIFMVGEQHRDIIPRKLAAGIPARGDAQASDTTIAVHEITSYETSVMESFPTDFARLVQPNLDRGVKQWVVVFSPSGGRAMLEGLGLLDRATGKVRRTATDTSVRQTRIATIGPTTRDYLLKNFNLEPDVVAKKPSPEGLGAAIEEFEARLRDG